MNCKFTKKKKKADLGQFCNLVKLGQNWHEVLIQKKKWKKSILGAILFQNVHHIMLWLSTENKLFNLKFTNFVKFIKKNPQHKTKTKSQWHENKTLKISPKYTFLHILVETLSRKPINQTEALSWARFGYFQGHERHSNNATRKSAHWEHRRDETMYIDIFKDWAEQRM